MTVDELFDDDTGRWQITTQTSIYILDLDAPHPAAHPRRRRRPRPQPRDRSSYPVTVLEDDRQPQPIWQLLRCVVGEPMYVYTNADATGVTLRGTTPLREIRSLTAPEPDHDR